MRLAHSQECRGSNSLPRYSAAPLSSHVDRPHLLSDAPIVHKPGLFHRRTKGRSLCFLKPKHSHEPGFSWAGFKFTLSSSLKEKDSPFFCCSHR
ncbi:hypothetical protein G7K_6161-t1 [Saitoella complicata NRRL Y-17804]|uniref:Uncharacterized protein n=1 Tax=Saitoella complicata (strain BCRC 22490 / CBS 7301 / JCM 7358 / NBRC 10748 / NRRL Y-17804) TaxID=698492 RepID=A0A0E9NRM4_SAICN|nr:hypothetical protein G7K_6161-t1 [Saitoella complicata NRRL Y-17804]